MVISRFFFQVNPKAFWVLLILVRISRIAYAGPDSGSIYLFPGENIQAIVDASPAKSRFTFGAGLYRGQTISPKDGDEFAGLGSVVMNGSQLISFSATQGKYWVADAKATGIPHGSCDVEHPLCAYSQDLFIDGALQRPVPSLSDLATGAWYFDRPDGKVYVSINPIGHVIELSAVADAFHGSAKGVRISNIIVEKYASPAQHGAIGGDRKGNGWIIENVEVRWNHGAGIEVGAGSQIRNSHIHNNGQLGVATDGQGSQVIGNEISWNNYAGFSVPWEAGGSKFWATTNLLVRSNKVHDNQGNGLWTDTDNQGTIYEENVVTNNKYSGIVHEISGSAIIRNNVVKDNGSGSQAKWLWNAQIQIQNSFGVEVYGNTVEVAADGGNGIVIINQNRGIGGLGPRIAANNNVHNNFVTYLGQHGASGYADDTRKPPQTSNRFDFNRYVSRMGGVHWAWISYKTWEAIHAEGQESHGVCCK